MLRAGTKLGPYEVVVLLGSGGMGEVYRARDPKLDREIALKVLPAGVAIDEERRLRFEQEARAASSLNHPNVVHVYDIGASEGTIYIAMELVEGRTLREALVPGALPTKKTVELAVQMADGLARAHEAGIVHRDLKPENVMVARDGHIRILDFGLAKLVDPPNIDASERPTTPQLTRSGIVMGTLGYMSPEQAAGGSVDFRSDQFSLGTILYEMASGRRAFRGATGPETLTAILRDQPEPLSKLNPALPAPFRWIVEERCLAKDPEERYASTRDLVRELQGIREHLLETRGADASPPAPQKYRRNVIVAILGGIAALALGVWAGRYSSTWSTIEPHSFKRLTFQRGEIMTARFAPDGQTIVFGARFQGRPPEVFSTRVDSPESRSLGLPPANLLSISSTGEMAVQIGSRRSIGWERTGTLARVPLGGGAPREILEEVEEADWSSDGKDLTIVRDVGGHRRLEFPIGKVLFETAGFISSPRVSPKGDRVAFLDHPTRGDNAGSVSVVDLAGEKKTLSSSFHAMRGLQWSPTGEEIWFGGAKSGRHIDLWALTLAGTERLLWNETGSIDILDVSKDGRVLTARVSLDREIRGRAPGASEERGLSWLDWSFPVSLSDDGSFLVFDEQGEGVGGSNAVYLRKTDGSPAVRLGEGRGLALSPDSRWVLAYSEQSLVILAVGAGMARKLPATGMIHHGAAWFPDGERIVLVANEPDRGTRLYMQKVSGGEPHPFTPEGVSFFFSGNPVSPDGKNVVARGPDRKLFLFPVDGGEPRAVEAVGPDEQVIRWTADGRGLYVHLPSEVPTKVEVVDLATGRRVLWKVLAPPDPAGVDYILPVLISRDGSAYAYSYRRQLQDLYLVKGLQ